MHFNNTLFWGLWSAWAVVCLTYFAYRGNERKKRGPLFPARGSVPVLYQENFASGRSFKNILTKFGVARNCLKLIVTPDELWVTTFFPFTLFAEFYDLEHRILKRSIVSVRERRNVLGGRSMIVAYTSEAGRIGEIELIPKRYDRFRQALEINTLML